MIEVEAWSMIVKLLWLSIILPYVTCWGRKIHDASVICEHAESVYIIQLCLQNLRAKCRYASVPNMLKLKLPCLGLRLRVAHAITAYAACWVDPEVDPVLDNLFCSETL